MVSFTDHYNAISIDRLSSKTNIGNDSWKRFMKIILLCKPQLSSTTRTSLFIKNTTNKHSWASYWLEYTKYCFKENPKILSKNSTTQDLVLKRMLELFTTVPPLKKMLQFQERICFFFWKTQNTTSSASSWWVNSKSSFKENAIAFSKGSTTHQIRISKPKKKGYEICTKKNFQQKSNQLLKTYKMNFINKKTKKENVLKFVLLLGKSWSAEKAPKISSE